MHTGRIIRLLLLAPLLVLGLAAGTPHSPAAVPPAVSTIGTQRESLPPPVHDEATCAFCQAAIFPPCAPQRADVTFGNQALVQVERPTAQARIPHFTSHRPTSSRAPPALRFA